MKPRGLGWLVLTMAVLNPTGLLFTDPRESLTAAVLCVVAITVGYVALWGLWRGKNWARWLVLVTSVVAILNLIGLAELSWLLQAVVVIEAGLGIYLLYWLNSREVKAFFRSGPPPSVA